MSAVSRWQEQNIQLEFRLAGLRLTRATFRGLLAKHELGTAIDSDVPNLLPGFDVAVILAYPSSNLVRRCDGVEHVFPYIPYHYERYYVDLSGSFADYETKFHSKAHYTLRKKLRRFKTASGGTLRWQEYRLPGEMTDFHSLARTISSTTHQERRLRMGLPPRRSFLDEMQRLAERDSIRGYILFLGEEPVSYMHCTVEHQSLLSRYLGYDPKYKELSPGVVLQYVLLERLFSQQVFRFLDFGWGSGGIQHRRLFATGSVTCTDLYYFRRTARNYTFVKLHSFLQNVSGGTGTILETLGMKSAIKELVARLVGRGVVPTILLGWVA